MLKTVFSKDELNQLEARGTSLQNVYDQLERLQQGSAFVQLEAPATPDHGIKVLTDDQVHGYADAFAAQLGTRSVLKFVPASGAASRMFKHLHEYRSEMAAGTVPNRSPLVEEFFKKLDGFAFSDALRKAMKAEGLDLGRCLAHGRYDTIIDYVLSPLGLNYASVPKGMVQFHRAGESSRTAFEEHLVEGALYARDHEGQVRLHFTVPAPHQESILAHLQAQIPALEERLCVQYEIELTVQKPSTDTIAVDLENRPLKGEDGTLLFRPGGHGALIENLNEVDADLVFVKNIDNVIPEAQGRDSSLYKRALGGHFLELQQQIFSFQQQLEHEVDAADLTAMLAFVEQELQRKIPAKYKALPPSELQLFIGKLLNRPLRVCGMVRNEGEPGGGPFWVQQQDETVTLQIVEKAQIDIDDEAQKTIFDQSTHFNPVDLVLGLKNYRGKAYDLPQFVDAETAFVVEKSKNGKRLKALELPGLWNGAMAHWNTVLVEVPSQTFNPVKTVNDLLKRASD